MPVYVDDSSHKFGSMTMCHMVADTMEELHAMADKINLDRKWFQNHPHHPHYDICKSKRVLAVKHGANEVTSRDIINIFRKKQGS